MAKTFSLKLSIGQMAKLNNISVQTLRYYEKMGLLSPKWVDAGSKYRYYDIEQSCILDMIKYLKKCDLSLEEIHHILSAEQIDAGQLSCLLEQKQNEIDREMRELDFKKAAIRNILNSLDAYQLMPALGTIVLEYFPKRYAFVYRGDCNYYQNTRRYEQGLMELKAEMAKYHLPHFYSFNPASLIRREVLSPGKLYCNELFVYIDELYAKDRVPLIEISGGTYFCIYCNEVLHEEKYTYQLIEHIQNNHMEIVGDGIEESISDLIAIRENRKNLIMRVKIPVRFQRFS